MKNTKKKKANFWKTFSIVILIFLLIKVIVTFIKEQIKKDDSGEKEEMKGDEEIGVFEEK